MSAETVQRDDGRYDVFYEGELAAENVPKHEAERLLDLYEFTEQAITREFGERGERFEAEWN